MHTFLHSKEGDTRNKFTIHVSKFSTILRFQARKESNECFHSIEFSFPLLPFPLSWLGGASSPFSSLPPPSFPLRLNGPLNWLLAKAVSNAKMLLLGGRKWREFILQSHETSTARSANKHKFNYIFLFQTAIILFRWSILSIFCSSQRDPFALSLWATPRCNEAFNIFKLNAAWKCIENMYVCRLTWLHIFCAFSCSIQLKNVECFIASWLMWLINHSSIWPIDYYLLKCKMNFKVSI